MVKIYALGNRDTGIHLSHYVWRVILALKHKKIEHEIEILNLVEVGPTISEITGGKWQKVPLVQFDDGSYIYDSFDIVNDLEKRYPDSPKLFPNGLSNAKFYDTAFMTLIGPLFKRNVLNMLKCLNEQDQKHFRKNSEEMFKCTLEEFVGDADSLIKSAEGFFDPIRAALKHAPYIEGSQPSYSDYILCSGFQWMRVVSPEDFGRFVTDNQDTSLKKWYDIIDRDLGIYPDGVVPTKAI